MSCEPTSGDFDPLLALYSDEKFPAAGDAKVYDNVAVFEANLKRKEKVDSGAQTKKLTRREKSFSQRKKIAAEVQNRDVSKLKQMMELRKKIDEEKTETSEDKVETTSKYQRREKTHSNLFSIMDKLSHGPMSLLHRIMKDHLLCHVYMRNFQGISGVLAGYVVAFDRYMNLVMTDVDETFALSPRGAVAQHQKRLSVCELEQALHDIKIHGVEDNRRNKPITLQGTSASNYSHLPASGVSFIRKRVEAKKDDVSSLKSSEHPSDSSSSNKRVVRLYETANPPPAHQQVFRGGGPQLYHRHIIHLYVRGDNVVLISLPS